jgi:hypothetical protein
MAAAKKKASKKSVKKATRKPQKNGKAKKASMAKTKAAKPQDAAGSRQSDSQNPYRVGGSYWACIEALTALGVGKMHPFAEIVPAAKKAMGDAWKAFADKDARNDKTGKDADHRLLQNISVLTRVSYGKPLRDIGYEVRWNGREKAAGLFKIGSD